MSDAAAAPARRRLADDAPVRVVSARAPLATRLANLWSRRELLRGLIVSDIRIKYKNSALGIVWSMLSPAAMLAMYYLVFSIFLKNGIPNFVVYLFSGLVVWNMFQISLNTATGVIVDRAGLVKKVSFPREILALANVGASVVYFIIQLAVLLLFLAIIGHAPDWGFLWLLPISFVTLYLFTASLAVIMSAVTVYMRDVKHLMEVVLQFWFWLTPVVYSYENSIAEPLHRHGLSTLYFLNPVTLIVLTFQRVFYVSTVVHSTTSGALIKILPTWSFARFFYLNVALLATMAVFFLVAESIFGRLEGNFESEL
ncbi:MAG TPA: ABC transporter permease [Acidimicrobiales bacterium]|nr:ABC transporter permease [Acidimicrobiales bacterium]